MVIASMAFYSARNRVHGVTLEWLFWSWLKAFVQHAFILVLERFLSRYRPAFALRIDCSTVLPIRVPPLRERPDDIPLLVAHFARHFAARQGKRIDEIPGPVMERLRQADWPGNVRELQNVIERAVVATTGHILQMPSGDRRVPQTTAPVRTLPEMERDYILAALDTTRGVIGG